MTILNVFLNDELEYSQEFEINKNANGEDKTRSLIKIILGTVEDIVEDEIDKKTMNEIVTAILNDEKAETNFTNGFLLKIN